MEQECLEKKFIVFNSEIDLRGHQAEVHRTSRKGVVVDLQFEYTRSQPNTQQTRSSPSSSRRKTRQNDSSLPAAASVNQPDPFPSLGNGQSPTVPRPYASAKERREEAFPTLSQSKKTAKSQPDESQGVSTSKSSKRSDRLLDLVRKFLFRALNRVHHQKLHLQLQSPGNQQKYLKF